jgi:two-component system, sensor histidine kinase and response regulator
MKKITILVYTAFFIILIGNFIYYRDLYNGQKQYVVELLDRQVQTVGFAVDSINNAFSNDFTKITYDEDLSTFFSNQQSQASAKERMKSFFSKYNTLVAGIKLFDNNRNEFTLKKDDKGDWLEQPYTLREQTIIYPVERLERDGTKFSYYIPVIDNKAKTISGNIVVTLDYPKYFKSVLSEFYLKDYQWQWVVSDSGEVVFDNIQRPVAYSGTEKIIEGLRAGSIENITHPATIAGRKEELISSFYSTTLMSRGLAIVFSAPSNRFQKDILRNSFLTLLGTLVLVQLIIYLLMRHIKAQQKETRNLRTSEETLFKLIDEMPVGVIVHNRNREILKANKVAATQYSYLSEGDMKGKIFPESTATAGSDYYSKNLGGTFNPDQFVIIKKEIGETVLYRNSIPVRFLGEDATMEILNDVTLLESARKKEERANEAKSEFLARMSYEIRTPLNGIIGMTDVLRKHYLSPDLREIVDLLHRSTEILLRIISDILDFSKIESGNLILDEIPFNLREEIMNCTAVATSDIAPAGVSFTCTIDDKVPENIIGDPFRLKQILSNLVNHSMRNTESGEIRLSCSLKKIDDGAITLGFELADTGRTFDTASLKKIFGDLVYLESKKVKSNDDSEFGTILARQLVELMGGKLQAVSPSGLDGEKGTRITFTIVTNSSEKKAKGLNFENIKSFDQVRTLVITGGQNRDESLLGMLHRIGLSFTITTFQRSTISQIKANMNFPAEKYNLVVISEEDDFDGFEAAKVIWENRLSPEFIILLVTGNDKKGNYLSSISLGIDHYLIKPFEQSELTSLLRNSFPFIAEQAMTADVTDIRTDLNILVVEDNKMNQNVIGTMLKNLGYTFDLADDGWSGYQMTRDKKYDLIFMDLIMPEMDGYESSQRILKIDKTALIIAFTADNMPETKRKAELAGIRDFISKPVKMDELKTVFARYFSNNPK